MAKRQRTMKDMFSKSVDFTVNVEVPSHTVSSTSSCEQQLSRIEMARLIWKDSWYNDFKWIEFNSNDGRVFCKLCRKNQAKNVFANASSINIKVSTFVEHQISKEHNKLAWATQEGQKVMRKMMHQVTKSCDEALLTLFRAAYYLDRKTIPFCKYSTLYDLLLTCKSLITNGLYYDEKSCAEMIYYISTVVHKKNLDRIRDSKFFGLMIDELIDISSTSHVVVFDTFVEEGLPISVFLDLFEVPNGKKDSDLIFESLQKRIKE